MKGKTGPVSNLLTPIMDTYMDSAVALVGCTSRGIDRYSCEFDVLIVTSESRPPTSLKLGDVFADIFFVSEKELLKPASPERALSIAASKPVRDTSLILSTSSAAAMATISESAAKATTTRLTSSLKTITRAEDSLKKDALVDADFWLLAASYELAYATLLSKETVPSPSHLLSQLRGAGAGPPKLFEGVSTGAGLNSAGRTMCGARLEGIMVLHDLLREGSRSATADSEWSEARTQILEAKALELMTRTELAECYSFLGQELVDDMLALMDGSPKMTMASLTTGGNKLLGERLVRQLGLSRDRKAVGSALEQVKRQVTLLTKKA